MATVRYRVDGVPPGWIDAFTPRPTLTPAGTFSIRHTISASWGTEDIPSPRPAGSARLSSSPRWHPPSDVAPDYFRPDVAVVDIRQMGGGGANAGRIRFQPRRAAVAPIPVGTINYPPAPVAMRGRKIGGRRSMHWPRVITRWPGLDGRDR